MSYKRGKYTSSPKNWISGEVSILGIGARYERMLNNKVSLGVNAYWNTLIWWNEIEVGASFRYYLFPSFFLGAGLGFHIHTGFYDYKYTDDWFGVERSYTGTWWGSIWGAALTPEIGWKIDVGKKGGFFIQPGLKIPITFGMLDAYTWGSGKLDKEFKVGFGVVPYFGLGFAF